MRAVGIGCASADHGSRSVECDVPRRGPAWTVLRSEEHTSELQSRQYLVCRLLLEKKKNNKHKLRLRKQARLQLADVVQQLAITPKRVMPGTILRLADLTQWQVPVDSLQATRTSAS